MTDIESALLKRSKKGGVSVKRMRAILAGLLAVLLCAGCASPAPDPEPAGVPNPAPAAVAEETIYPEIGRAHV